MRHAPSPVPLALLLALAAFPAAAEAPEPSLPGVLHFDESDLPDGGSGWLLVTLRVHGTHWLSVDSRSEPTFTRGVEAHGIILHGGAGAPLVTGFSGHDRSYGASFDGVDVGCCTQHGFTQRAAGSRIGWGMGIADGQVVRAGFFAANWVDGSRLAFNVTAYQGGGLELLDVSTGTDVQAVDLVAEAYRQGRNARASPWMVGDAGAASGTLASDAPGVLVGLYETYGDESIGFEVALPDGSAFRDEGEPGGFARVSAAVPAGAGVSWRVDEVRERTGREGLDEPLDAHLVLVRLGLDLPGAAGSRQENWG